MRIAARGLVVRFGERAALAGLDCDLVSGELVGLIGPNGAGKTTLLRVLGIVSIVSAEPTPHSPPIAMPNSARTKRSIDMFGAKPEAISRTE